MKLLPQSHNTDWQEEIGELELHKLYCLRSIAVNLETIALVLGAEFDCITDDQYGRLLAQIQAHSVREVPGD